MIFEEKMMKTRFVVDSGRAHITVDKAKCAACAEGPCVSVCPAQCYTKELNEIGFSWEGCVECGSCRIVCPHGAIVWEYPRGGYGVCYRFG